MKVLSKNIRIPFYETKKDENDEVISTENFSKNPLDFGSNKMKAERKQRKKMEKFYTRQAKRNNFLKENGFDSFVTLDNREFV